MAVQRSNAVIEIIGYSGNSDGMRRVMVWANTIAEAPTVQDTWEVGSILWDITAKKLYLLNKSGAWVAQ